MRAFVAAVCSALLVIAAGVASAEPVATVVALRGKATIERNSRKIAAQSKMGVELRDTVATAEGGKIKLLFIDDSVLTLAENTRMNIDTFVHSRSDRGKSLFNLIDGRMRAVVGKTRFEVKTPTVIAAARGTVILFDTGTLNGQPFTRITCLEGVVDVHSTTAAAGTPPVLLSPGRSILVVAGQPIPAPTTLSPAEIQKLQRATSMSVTEVKLPDVTTSTSSTTVSTVTVTPVAIVPTVNEQPAKQPSKVTIGVKF